MIKKILLLCIALLPGIMGAQRVTDTWVTHPFFAGANNLNNIDTGDCIYYLSCNQLFCFYKDTQENESLNKTNYLNGVTITGIYYDCDNRQLYVAYDNGNIDIIDQQGSVNNMCDITTSALSMSKGINDITFDGRYAYAATDFGYVVIDGSNYSVKESRVYNKVLASLIHVGSWVVAIHAEDIYIGKSSEYRETLNNYKYIDINRRAPRVVPVDNDHFLLTSQNGLDLCTIHEDGGISVAEVDYSSVAQVLKTSSGFVVSCPSANYYLTLDATGGNVQRHEVAIGELVTISPNGNETWGLNDKGLHKVGDEANYFKPSSIGISSIAFWSVYNPGDDKIYLSSTCDNAILSSAIPNAKTEIWTYDGNDWEDATPADVPHYSGQEGNYCPVFVPGSTCEYLFSTSRAGICHVKDGKIVNVYHFDNMPRDSKYMAALGIDDGGNLYAVQSSATNECPVMILPKAKLNNPTTVTKEDWITPNIPQVKVSAGEFKRSAFIIAPKSGVKVFTSGKHECTLVIWDDKNNIKNLNPPVKVISSMVDQDGAAVEWSYIRCMTADADGNIWVGTDLGVFSFNPADAFKDGFHCTRFKVARDDGTSLADYLLDGTQINCITIDGAGRKWIGTHSGGLFLVSANGTQIIKSFNIDNSPLVSNTIYSVCCTPKSNSVYIVTSKGVMEYFTDIVPASKDYTDIRVFPNPVRPQEAGLVTIAGLMENSLVKIVDNAGNVVKQLKSEGGMCTWDCYSDGGNRIKSGVYYVIASQNEGGNGSSAMTKFVVIN